jgi:hypothetical protein
MLFDQKGNDTYSAKWFAQGAAESSGVGMLIDGTGDDSYICGSFNSQGSGRYNHVRETGSIGLLMDLEGKDFYTGKGEDNLLWHQGKYGGGIDLPKSPLTHTEYTWAEHTDTLHSLPIAPHQKPTRITIAKFLPELEQSLEDEEQRQKVIMDLSEKGPRIVPDLIAYLQIKDVRLTRTIIEIIEKIGTSAIPPLAEALKEHSDDTSLTATILYILGNNADETSQDILLAFLKSDSPSVRSMAMRGISKLNPPPPLVLLKPHIADKSHAVRKYLAVALNNYSGETAVSTLTQFLSDHHFSVRFAAFESLKDQISAAKPYLQRIVDNQEEYPHYAVNLAKDIFTEGKMLKK